jgi:type III restriction enzyme
MAQIAWEVIRKLENQPQTLPTHRTSEKPEIQAAIVKAVERNSSRSQSEMDGMSEKPDIAAVVAKTVDLVTQQTIDYPAHSGRAQRRGEIRL